MKLLIRFLLSLFVVLFCGYGQLYAAGYHPASTVTVATSATNEHIAAGDNAVIKTGSPAQDRQDDRIDDTDEEDDDDEPTSAKKSLTALHCHSPFLRQLSAGRHSRYTAKRLSFYKHFSYTSTNTHIVYRVIRI